MDYELEVFEVYDDSEQQTSRRHTKHTRKKCKQKQKAAVLSIETADNDINRSKTSVVNSDRRHLSLCESILSVFSKLVVWKDQRRYQTTVPDKLESPHSSKDFRKGYMPCGKCSTIIIGQERKAGASPAIYMLGHCITAKTI